MEHHTPVSNLHYNKTRQRILQPRTLLQGFVFPGWEHQEYHAHIWAAPPSHYPKRKGQPHFWYVEPHNQHKHKLFLAELPGDCCDLQLTHRQPAPFLDHPGCGSHSLSAFGTVTAEAGVFVKFPPPPLLLCAWPKSCLPLCHEHAASMGWAEGGHRALGGRWKSFQCGAGWSYGDTRDRERAGCTLAIADLLMQRGKSLESLSDTQTNQGIYYFSPWLYHPAKKRSKKPPCANPSFLHKTHSVLLAAD